MMNNKEILNGTEYRFLQTNEHLGKHVILLGLAGSYSYGTNIDTSDIDVRGITLNQKSDLIGLEELVLMKIREIEEKENIRVLHVIESGSRA